MLILERLCVRARNTNFFLSFLFVGCFGELICTFFDILRKRETRETTRFRIPFYQHKINISLIFIKNQNNAEYPKYVNVIKLKSLTSRNVEYFNIGTL